MNYYNFLEQLILSAGALTLHYRQNLAKLNIHEKNATVRDLVSEADIGVEQYIREQIAIAFPEHRFIGEELGAENSSSEDLCWLVDPIDGTVNFVKGSPYYSVSIALRQGRKTLCAAVFAPAMEQLYIAEQGHAAFAKQVEWLESLDALSVFSSLLLRDYRLSLGRQLSVRKLPKLSEAVLITGFGCIRADIQPNNYLYLGYILPEVSDVRRFGSAALDICMVAAGVFDGFWEIGLHLYDLAAACLILEEAGGQFSDLYGGIEDFPSSVLATPTPEIHSQLLELFSQAEKPYNGFRSLLCQRQQNQHIGGKSSKDNRENTENNAAI